MVSTPLNRRDIGGILLKSAICYILFLLIFVTGCNTVDDLVDDYNSTFKIDNGSKILVDNAGGIVLCPGDEGFDPSLILRDQYVIPNDALLQLGAPLKCSKYEWTITNKAGTRVNFTCYEASASVTAYTERLLRIYIPYSHIQCGTYRLKIAITGDNGVDYEDTADLIIYEKIASTTPAAGGGES